MPGVSGAMLAINFNVYERLLESITHFFNDPKANIKYLFIFGLGAIISIILFSNIILFLLNNYKFVTMMFFIGLIFGGTYNFAKKITYNSKNSIWIIIIIISFLILALSDYKFSYQLRENFMDNVIFFIGGIIEIMASIVPGISGTSLLMMMGIYNHVLGLISNLFNFSFVFNNINLYISYGIGLMVSFVIFSYLISFLLKKYKNMTYSIILGLSIASLLYLLINTFKVHASIIQIILGFMLLMIGILISCILDK